MFIKRRILQKIICYFCTAFFILAVTSPVVSPSYAVNDPPAGNSGSPSAQGQGYQGGSGQGQGSQFPQFQLLEMHSEPGTIRAEKPIYITSHDIIRIIGTNMQKNGRYWVNIYDGKDSLVATIGVLVDKETGGFIAAYQIKGWESPREWRAEVGKGNNPKHIEARCTFIVEAAAIPELPAGITGIVVAGICGFIYYRMRKGKETLAA